MSIHAPMPIVTTLSSVCILLSGCATAPFETYTPAADNSHTVRQNAAGLSIAVAPFTDEAQIQRYFRLDLLGRNVLPLHVVLKNASPRATFVVLLEDVRMKGATDNSLPARSEVNRPTASGWAPVLFAPPVFAGVIAEAAAAENNLTKQQLGSTTLQPGGGSSGFVYFRRETRPRSGERCQVAVTATDVESGARHQFDFELVIK